MNLRCRGPQGQFNLTGVDPSTSFACFQQSLEKSSGIEAYRQEILSGFPPKLLQIPQNKELSVAQVGLSTGETLLLRAKEPAPEPASSSPAKPVAGAADPSSIDLTQDEDEQLARAIAASMEDTPAASSNAGASATARNSGNQSQSAGHSNGQSGNFSKQRRQKSADVFAPVSLGDGSVLVRRIIESDNSCLFNAVGYVMEKSRNQSRHLRQVIAETVAQDKQTYTAEFLGSRNDEYQQWIQDSKKWGGAIELSILSRYYGREIAAYDIQTKRVDVYGQDQNYSERAFILYDGLHYDALAQAAFDGAPEELDITLFETVGSDFVSIERAASTLVAKAHEAKQFTDTGNFTLMCGICKAGVKGEKEALQHAKETGHQSFQEYH